MKETSYVKADVCYYPDFFFHIFSPWLLQLPIWQPSEKLTDYFRRKKISFLSTVKASNSNNRLSNGIFMEFCPCYYYWQARHVILDFMLVNFVSVFNLTNSDFISQYKLSSLCLLLYVLEFTLNLHNGPNKLLYFPITNLGFEDQKYVKGLLMSPLSPMRILFLLLIAIITVCNYIHIRLNLKLFLNHANKS